MVLIKSVEEIVDNAVAIEAPFIPNKGINKKFKKILIKAIKIIINDCKIGLLERIKIFWKGKYPDAITIPVIRVANGIKLSW